MLINYEQQIYYFSTKYLCYQFHNFNLNENFVMLLQISPMDQKAKCQIENNTFWNFKEGYIDLSV